MSYFTDLLARRHQQSLTQPTLLQQTQQDPAQPVLPNSQQQSPLYNTEKFYSITPTAPAKQPKVDTSNAIGSLAEMLGPTPAEREAQQAKLERGRQQMAMWTGLFDGLRQLGNLYYTAKGARPQQYSDPYKTIDENYNREVKRLDDLAQYQRAYGQQLYNLQRQGELDKMQRESHQATLDWKKTQEEALREKTRQQEEKNQSVVKYYDALESKNAYQAAYWKARAEGYSDEAASRIAKNYAQANKARQSGGGTSSISGDNYVIDEIEYNDDGKVIKKKRHKEPRSTSKNGKTPKGYVKSGTSSKTGNRSKGRAY